MESVMKLRSVISLLLVLGSVSFCRSQDSKTSTPQERAHWAEVLHQLETQPLDPALNQQAAAVFKRLVEVSDFHMSICPVIGELPEKKYKNVGPIMQLFTLGLAAYQVETGKTDGLGANVYALHSVLKGYNSILAIDPKAKDKKLDALMKMDTEDKLPELVQKKKCS